MPDLANGPGLGRVAGSNEREGQVLVVPPLQQKNATLSGVFILRWQQMGNSSFNEFAEAENHPCGGFFILMRLKIEPAVWYA